MIFPEPDKSDRFDANLFSLRVGLNLNVLVSDWVFTVSVGLTRFFNESNIFQVKKKLYI